MIMKKTDLSHINLANLMRCDGKYYRYDPDTDLWLSYEIEIKISGITDTSEANKDLYSFANGYVLILDNLNKCIKIEKLKKTHYCFKRFANIKFISDRSQSVEAYNNLKNTLNNYLGSIDFTKLVSLIIDLTFNSNTKRVIYAINHSLTFIYEVLTRMYLGLYESWIYDPDKKEICKKSANCTSKFIMIMVKSNYEFISFYKMIQKITYNKTFIIVNASGTTFKGFPSDVIDFSKCTSETGLYQDFHHMAEILLSTLIHLTVKK